MSDIRFGQAIVLFTTLSGILVLAGTLDAQSQSSSSKPVVSSVNKLLNQAVKDLRWAPCMVLDSPNLTLGALGAPELVYDESQVAFMGPSGGKGLRLADFGGAVSAAKALAVWRKFRLKQGFWKEIPREEYPPLVGASDATILIGDKGSGAELRIQTNRYLITVTQLPEGTKTFDEAEQARVVALAITYANVMIKQIPRATLSKENVAPATKPSGTDPAPAKPESTARLPKSGSTSASVDKELEEARLRQSIAKARASVYAESGHRDKAAFFENHAAYWQSVIENRLKEIAAQKKREATP